MIALAALLAAPCVGAQCPNDVPQLQDDATDQYLAVCHSLPPGSGCPAPSAPQVQSGSRLSQEAVLTAVVPTGYTGDEAVWLAEYQRPNGAWHGIFPSWRSVQGAPFSGGSTVTFGAPGLQLDATHRYRVAFCNSSNCLCWSDPTQDLQDTDFSGNAPSSPFAQIMEDHFTRPETDPQCVTQGTVGDGLGPTDVWRSCESQTDHSARIEEFCDSGGANCFHAARGTPSSGMKYTATPARHEHTYAEAKVRVVDPNTSSSGFKFNLQLGAWNQPGTWVDPQTMMQQNVEKSWNAKLVFMARGCDTNPVLMIAKLPNEYSDAKCDANGDPELPGGICTDGTSRPPLDVEDSSYPGLSEPVWMRIEVAENANEDPVITAKVGWDGCADAGGVDSCNKSCTASRTDVLDSEMTDPGEWLISLHEFDYAIEIFRAGSETVCGDGHCDATEDCSGCSVDCGSC